MSATAQSGADGMRALQRIVAATDMSAHAVRAENRAAMLAAASGAQLELVHVVERGPLDALRRIIASEPAGAVDSVLAQAQRSLSERAAELANRHGIEVQTQLPTGLAASEVVGSARARDAELLVLGAHGQHYLRDLVLGTTAARLLEGAPCSLLVVRCEPSSPYRRVLVPVDFSAASVSALRFSASLAPDAQLYLLHAYEVPFEDKMRFAGVSESTFLHYRNLAGQEARRGMEDFVARAAQGHPPTRVLVEYGYAPAVIARVAEEVEADLIVMGARGRSELSYMLMGSVALHTIQNANCDVAAFRDRHIS